MEAQRNEASGPKSHSLLVLESGFQFSSPLAGDPRDEGGVWAQGSCSSGVDPFTSLYRRAGGYRLPGLGKKGFTGSFGSQKLSEGRGYLRICAFSLGIRKYAPTLPPCKGPSDKGSLGQTGGCLGFAECQSRHLLTADAGGGAPGRPGVGVTSAREVLEVLEHSGSQGRRNGVHEDVGGIFFLTRR